MVDIEIKEGQKPLLTIKHLLPVNEREIGDDDWYIEMPDGERYRVAMLDDLSAMDRAHISVLGNRWFEWRRSTTNLPDPDDEPDAYQAARRSIERFEQAVERYLPMILPGVPPELMAQISGGERARIVERFFLIPLGIGRMLQPAEPNGTAEKTSEPSPPD